jgi:uncharacterized membrane protein
MDKKTLGIVIGIVVVVVIILIVVIAIIIVKNKKPAEQTTDSTDTKDTKESFSRLMFVEGAKQKNKEQYTPAVSNADKRVKDALDKWTKF